MIFHPCQMGAWEPVFWLSVGSGCNAFLSVVNQAVVKKKKSPSFLPERVCCHAKSGNSRFARSLLCLHNKTAYSKKYIYFFTFQAKARCVHIKGRVREPPCRVVFNAANSITCWWWEKPRGLIPKPGLLTSWVLNELAATEVPPARGEPGPSGIGRIVWQVPRVPPRLWKQAGSIPQIILLQSTRLNWRAPVYSCSLALFCLFFLHLVLIWESSADVPVMARHKRGLRTWGENLSSGMKTGFQEWGKKMELCHLLGLWHLTTGNH